MLPLISSRISVRGLGLAFGDQARRRADLARRAIAALEGVMIDEGLLQRMQRAVLRKPLDRGDACAILHDRQRQAGNNAPAVDQHGAGAALALVATLFRAGQIEMLAQHVEQRRARIERQRAVCPVHGEIHGNRVRCIGARRWLSGSILGQTDGNRYHCTAGQNSAAGRMSKICIGFVFHEGGSNRMDRKLEPKVGRPSVIPALMKLPSSLLVLTKPLYCRDTRLRASSWT